MRALANLLPWRRERPRLELVPAALPPERQGDRYNVTYRVNRRRV